MTQLLQIYNISLNFLLMFGTSTFKRVLHIALFLMKKILANLVLNRIFVTDKTAACFFLGGYLRNRGRILLQCKIECCSIDNCNTQIPTLSQDAVTVFSPNGNGTFTQRMTSHIKSKLCNALLPRKIEHTTRRVPNRFFGIRNFPYLKLGIRDLRAKSG